MKKVESGCVNCGLPCLGKSCPNHEETHYYCDKCGDETTLYNYDGEELCADCILKLYEKVKGSEE